MPKKKTEETVEETANEVVETEELSAETVEAIDAGNDEGAMAESVATTEEKPKKSKKKETKAAKETSVVDSVAETVSDNSPQDSKKKSGKRAERIGIVQSDKMTKTVTVRVDRVVKHPVYRKYVKRRKNFMAHDEKGAGIGDKVRIIETRPLSARKRWRVVEIIQKAEK